MSCRLSCCCFPFATDNSTFAIDLKWDWKDGESENEAFKQAVLDQLGLDLAPSREPVEMLVVEKVP